MKIKFFISFISILTLVIVSCEDDFKYESTPPQQNPVYSIYDFMKTDTTLETMVLAIDRAGIKSLFDGTSNEKVTLLSLSDAAWRLEFRRNASAGYPNPYRNKTINDIPADNLKNFILGNTLGGEFYTTTYPYPFDITVATLNPTRNLRLQVENSRYLLTANRGSNPAAGVNGRNHFRSNIQMTNGILFTYDNFFSLIP